MSRRERRAANAHYRRALRQTIAQPPPLAAPTKRRLTVVGQTYERFDAEVDHVLKTRYKDATISCDRGCAHCCEQYVFATLPEATEVVDRYPEVVREVWPTLIKHEIKAVELGLNDDIVDTQDPYATDEREAFLNRWFETRTPCAFLDPRTHDCRVYEARPLACRGYFVGDQPNYLCAIRRSEDPTVKMNIANVFAEIVAHTQTLESASRVLMGKITIGGFSSLVAWVAAHHPELREKLAEVPLR